MYSIVLAAVMTGGAQAPDWGFCRGWCGGCHCGGWCHGWCGCYCGGWCRGWCGGWCSCGGCYGGSCYCGGWCGCYGCYGGGVVVAPASYSYYYPVPPVTARPSDPAAPRTDAEREAVRKVLESMRQQRKPITETSDTARLTIRLPAEARLYVDNVFVPFTSGTRSFQTPRLEPGRQYFYILRMEINRDGRPVSEDRRVVVAAGRHVEVDFNTVSTVQR